MAEGVSLAGGSKFLILSLYLRFAMMSGKDGYSAPQKTEHFDKVLSIFLRSLANPLTYTLI
ncbi:hypothetical protein [uncultured Thermosynechococcus sp.]|uniref:hypothetical protein n=1 Tax=uncultured Thermosynechococcus sp. TaxID=436945 RepID=UPI00260F57DC|nr:hypothetical protein [uncultured Thermosynechococcus sp.]